MKNDANIKKEELKDGELEEISGGGKGLKIMNIDVQSVTQSNGTD